MKLILRHFNLKLKDNFKISRLSFDVKPTLIVELHYQGISGYGEATENAYYQLDTFQIETSIAKHKDFIESLFGIEPKLFWTKLYPHFKDNHFALCALDVAYHDLFTKLKGIKLYEYLKLRPHNLPFTNYTIGIAEIPKMIEKMKAMPWPIYKIKLGTPNDIEIIKALRKQTNAIFRVAANCGWTVDETIHNSKIFSKLGVEFIEQPLKANDWEGYKKVFKNSKLPVIADESCIVEEDVAKCHTHFHGVNIKLMKCGGLTPGIRMIKEAKELGLKTMVGCMTESTIGISAIAHLLPLLDYADMDGALLLEKDIAVGVKIVNGKVFYSNEMGTGAQLIEN